MVQHFHADAGINEIVRRQAIGDNLLELRGVEPSALMFRIRGNETLLEPSTSNSPDKSRDRKVTGLSPIKLVFEMSSAAADSKHAGAECQRQISSAPALAFNTSRRLIRCTLIFSPLNCPLQVVGCPRGQSPRLFLMLIRPQHGSESEWAVR